MKLYLAYLIAGSVVASVAAFGAVWNGYSILSAVAIYLAVGAVAFCFFAISGQLCAKLRASVKGHAPIDDDQLTSEPRN